MKGIGTFSPDGKHKWMVFLLVVLVQLGVLSYIGWRWHNISVDGIPYQWRCLPRLEESSSARIMCASYSRKIRLRGWTGRFRKKGKNIRPYFP